MLIDIPNDSYNTLLELADFWGYINSDSIAVVQVIDRLCLEQLKRDDEPEFTDTSPKLNADTNPSAISAAIATAVNKITNFNAGGEVIINEANSTAVDIETPPSYEELLSARPKDKVLLSCLTEPMKIAASELYSNIPTDLWGTDQAAKLLTRHMTLIAQSARNCLTCEE